MRKNTPALVLGIGHFISVFVSLFLPLWTVDYINDRFQEVHLSFNAYKVAGATNYFYEQYKFLPGLFTFLIILIYLLEVGIIISAILVYSSNNGTAKALATIFVSVVLFIFFVFMIIGFVASASYLGSQQVAVGWGEFPLLIVFGDTLPFIFLVHSKSYGVVKTRKTQSSFSKYSATYGPNYSSKPSASVGVSSSVGELGNGKKFSQVRGAQRLLDVYEDRVVLTQLQNFRAFMTNDYFKGEKSIPFSSMTSIQFKEASSMILGYIQFEVPGVNNSSNFGSENSWTYYDRDNALARQIYEYCHKRMMECRSGVQPQNTQSEPRPAPAKQDDIPDQILKYKKLLDAGAITQEEYDAKKKELLAKY